MGRPSAGLDFGEASADGVRKRPRPGERKSSLPSRSLRRDKPTHPPPAPVCERLPAKAGADPSHFSAPQRRPLAWHASRPPPRRTPRKREASHNRHLEDQIARVADRFSSGLRNIWRKLICSLDAGTWSHPYRAAFWYPAFQLRVVGSFRFLHRTVGRQ